MFATIIYSHWLLISNKLVFFIYISIRRRLYRYQLILIMCLWENVLFWWNNKFLNHYKQLWLLCSWNRLRDISLCFLITIIGSYYHKQELFRSKYFYPCPLQSMCVFDVRPFLVLSRRNVQNIQMVSVFFLRSW